jgi:hypothetical protein
MERSGLAALRAIHEAVRLVGYVDAGMDDCKPDEIPDEVMPKQDPRLPSPPQQTGFSRHERSCQPRSRTAIWR